VLTFIAMASRRGRIGGLIVCFCGLLTALPAAAEIRCAAPPEAAPALAATDGRVRLAWIDRRLSAEAHRMSIWNWGWAAGIGAAGVGTLLAVPFVAPENRVDYYTGAVLAAAGIVPFLVAPPAVIGEAHELHGRLLGAPLETDAEVCALLADAERRLVHDARDERLRTRWWAHAANVAINAGGFFFLGFAYHHWLSGTINGLAGVAIGEAVIFTQPERTIDDLARYRQGDLGP
jgi:hypothetical protein